MLFFGHVDASPKTTYTKLVSGPIVIDMPQVYQAPGAHTIAFFIPANTESPNALMQYSALHTLCYFIDTNITFSPLSSPKSHMSLADRVSKEGGFIKHYHDNHGMLVIIHMPAGDKEPLEEILGALIVGIQNLLSKEGGKSMLSLQKGIVPNMDMELNDILEWLTSNFHMDNMVLLDMPSSYKSQKEYDIAELIENKIVSTPIHTPSRMQLSLSNHQKTKLPEMRSDGLIFIQDDSGNTKLELAIPLGYELEPSTASINLLRHILTSTHPDGFQDTLASFNIISPNTTSVEYDYVNHSIDVSVSLNLESSHTISSILSYIRMALVSIFSKHQQDIMDLLNATMPHNLINLLAYETELSLNTMQSISNHLYITAQTYQQTKELNQQIEQDTMKKLIDHIAQQLQTWNILTIFVNIQAPSTAVPIGSSNNTLFVPAKVLKKSLDRKPVSFDIAFSPLLPIEEPKHTIGWMLSSETAIAKIYSATNEPDGFHTSFIPWETPKSTCAIVLENAYDDTEHQNNAFLADYIMNIPDMKSLINKLTLYAGDLSVYTTVTGIAILISAPSQLLTSIVDEAADILHTHKQRISQLASIVSIKNTKAASKILKRWNAANRILTSTYSVWTWIIGNRDILDGVHASATKLLHEMSLRSLMPESPKLIASALSIPSYASIQIATPLISNCVRLYLPSDYIAFGLAPYSYKCIFFSRTTFPEVNPVSMNTLAPNIINKINSKMFEKLRQTAISRCLYSPNLLAYHLTLSPDLSQAIENWNTFAQSLLTLTFKEWLDHIYHIDINIQDYNPSSQTSSGIKLVAVTERISLEMI